MKPDQVALDRYLFYTACTRATRRLYLVREAASDEGSPREPSPFWDEVARLFPKEEVERATTRRSLSALTWPLDDAPTDRERLRALAALAVEDEPEAAELASANGWERRFDRALRAFERPTRLTHPLVLEQLRDKTIFNVTELERFSDCSSAWFVERFLRPKTIDAEVDAKLRGSVAHNALNKFFGGIPKELGIERLDEEHLDRALPFLRRCLDDAVNGVRMELTELQRQELDQGLWRDLEAFVRIEAVSKISLVPQKFEVSFGGERSTLGGLDLGDGLDAVGEDRPRRRRDVRRARDRAGLQVRPHRRTRPPRSRRSSGCRSRSTCSCCATSSASSRSAASTGRSPASASRAGCCARARRRSCRASRAPTISTTRSSSSASRARGRCAHDLGERIREGDVTHDPRGGSCPTWCDLWTVCRVKRA